jgi:hypothetical protein
MEPAVGFGAKTKALGRLLGTGLGSRSQLGRKIQRQISEQ